jgi:hypothetical protein
VNDVVAPSLPSNLGISGIINHHPRFTWDTNTEADLKEYKVYRKVEGYDADFVLIATTTNTYYIDQTNFSDPKFGGNVYYRVKAVDYCNNFSGYSNTVNAKGYVGFPGQGSKSLTSTLNITLTPSEITLFDNYPNPFNPKTIISFSLPNESQVKLTVYSITGEKVKELINGFREKGVYKVEWNGTNQNGTPVSTGIYIYELIAGDQRLAKKMFLAK